LRPSFASAYAMAAWCRVQSKVRGWMQDRAQEIAETARLARRAAALGQDDAVALDPDLRISTLRERLGPYRPEDLAKYAQKR
jgi:hypothetical protein